MNFNENHFEWRHVTASLVCPISTRYLKEEWVFRFCVFFKFCHMNVQYIKIIVLKFEVDWSKTNGDMNLRPSDPV